MAEIISLVLGTSANLNEFRVLAALLHGSLLVGISQTAALNRGHNLYSAERSLRWALAHISSFVFNFFITLFLFGSMRQNKLATRQLLGSR